MIITIAGQAGAGKDTAGQLVSRKLGLRMIKTSMKTYAHELGIDVLSFEKKYAAHSKKWDLEIDSWEHSQAKRGNCVVVSVLSAYNAPQAELKVWLFASERERACRIAKRDKIPASRALAYVRQRDRTTRARHKKLYGIDTWNPLLYDVCINTGKIRPDSVLKIILDCIKR